MRSTIRKIPALARARFHSAASFSSSSADFMETPPPKYFRLKPGGEVRLKYAYIIQVRRSDARTRRAT